MNRVRRSNGAESIPMNGTYGSALCLSLWYLPLDNPYASPDSVAQPEDASAWITQARVVAILLLIQGICEFAVGFLLIYQWTKSAVAVFITCLVYVLAILKIAAGVRNYQRRNRRLGILALAVAPFSLFTFFCVPSALVLMVYGLVVYLHRDVKRAFAVADGLEK
jgi:hypothetical protein